MGVKLRENKKKNGTISLYLDITHDGKRSKEYLGLSLPVATTKEQRKQNRELREIAESTRSKRQLELQANDHNHTPSFKKNVDFVQYFNQFLADYENKDRRLVERSFEWFKVYLKDKLKKESLPARELTESICSGYKRHLTEKLNGETPYNYFTKFKKVIRQAVKDKILTENPADGIKNEKSEGLKKDILSLDEIQQLAKSYCGNDEVKRAFLFSLNTGLRWIDLKSIKYKNIDFSTSKLKIEQVKLKGKRTSQLIVDLNNTALRLIGDPKSKEELIFTLPSHAGGLKSIKLWVKKAGIDKHITWHCGRHSFAVNILSNGNDVKTTSSLLGHSSLKNTEKYLHVVSELKKRAVNTLPELDF